METVYANMQFALSVLIRTNQSATEVLRTRLCVIQILRNTRGAVTDYLILRGGEIPGGVAKHFVTRRLGKVEFEVA